MHLRSHLRQDQMNCPAYDVVSPGLIRAAERFQLQRCVASECIEVLSVSTSTALLDDWAKSGWRGMVDDDVGEFYPSGSRNPGGVSQDRTRGVELPECDLRQSSVSTTSRPQTLSGLRLGTVTFGHT